MSTRHKIDHKVSELRTHQPGEDRFQVINSEDVQWKPFASFPPAARLAILVGDPTQAGPYLIRVKLPAGTKIHGIPSGSTVLLLPAPAATTKARRARPPGHCLA